MKAGTGMKKAPVLTGAFRDRSGGVLLSHAVARAVPSGLRGLTTVFGMGTGVAPSLEPPESGEPNTVGRVIASSANVAASQKSLMPQDSVPSQLSAESILWSSRTGD